MKSLTGWMSGRLGLCLCAALAVAGCDDGDDTAAAQGADAAAGQGGAGGVGGEGGEGGAGGVGGAGGMGGAGGEGGMGGAGGEGGMGGAGGQAAAAPNLFQFGVEVRTPAGPAQATYVQAIHRDQFDGRHIDNANGVEIQGIARLFTIGGWAFAGEWTAPLLHRYAVADDGTFTESDNSPLSFADSGATRVDIGQVHVSPEKAYFMWSATLAGVVWNPDTMLIEDTFDLTPAVREGYEGMMLMQGAFLFEHVVRDERAFVSTLHSSNADGLYYPNMTVTVFDTTTDRIIDVIEDDRCYGPSTMLKAANGDIYVSSYSFTGRPYQLEAVPYKPTCVLRIKAGEQAFDPDFFVSFPALLDGAECTRWYPVNGRYSYCMAIPLADLSGADNTSRAPGTLWQIDLDGPAAWPVEGVPAGSPFQTLGYPDSPDSLVIGFPDQIDALDSSTVYRLVPADSSATAIFTVDGLFRGFYPLR